MSISQSDIGFCFFSGRIDFDFFPIAVNKSTCSASEFLSSSDRKKALLDCVSCSITRGTNCDATSVVFNHSERFSNGLVLFPYPFVGWEKSENQQLKSDQKPFVGFGFSFSSVFTRF